ncbi:hypothetical protein ACJX0J_017311, partial [Zea mays]
ENRIMLTHGMLTLLQNLVHFHFLLRNIDGVNVRFGMLLESGLQDIVVTMEPNHKSFSTMRRARGINQIYLNGDCRRDEYKPIKKAAHNFGTEMSPGGEAVDLVGPVKLEIGHREVTRALTSNLVALEMAIPLDVVEASEKV